MSSPWLAGPHTNKLSKADRSRYWSDTDPLQDINPPAHLHS